MKVFIYRNFLNAKALEDFYGRTVQTHGLERSFAYFNDLVSFFKKSETEDPEAADLFFIPLFATAFHRAGTDIRLFVDGCAHLAKRRHVLVFDQACQSGETSAPLYPWLDDRFIVVGVGALPTSTGRDIVVPAYAVDAKSERGAEPPKRFLMNFLYREADKAAASAYVREFETAAPDLFKNNPVGSLTDIHARFPELAGANVDDIQRLSYLTVCQTALGGNAFAATDALRNGSVPIVPTAHKAAVAGEIDWSKYAYALDGKGAVGLATLVRTTALSDVHEKIARSKRDAAQFSKAAAHAALEQRLELIVNPTPMSKYVRRATEVMRPPSKMHIMCVDVTNKCDLACSNCTRLLENQEKFWDMTVDNWRLALRSLQGYPGVIAMIGGNPCMHPQFTDLCQVFREEIPEQRQRGLWSNNIFKHIDVIKETFGAFNLNAHGEARGIKSLKPLREQVGYGNYFEGHSQHAPLLTAVKDLFPEEQMWEKIYGCDINREWSGSIVQTKDGELRAYFCEVAAAFDVARGGDNGLKVAPGWWRRPLTDFAHQIERMCTGCGVPARLKGNFDHEEIDTYTESNRDLAERSAHLKKRKIVKVESGQRDLVMDHKVTDYTEQLQQRYNK